MSHYDDLDDTMKHIISMMAEGLMDGTIESIWIPITGDNRLRSIFGVNSWLIEEVRTNRFQLAEWNMLIKFNFIFPSNGNSFTLNRQGILNAYNTNFEDPIEADLSLEQKNLLYLCVEAMFNTPFELRQLFIFSMAMGNSQTVTHYGLPSGKIGSFSSDLETLNRAGLIAIGHRNNSGCSFDVTNRGLKYYKQLKRSQGQPIQRTERAFRNYIDGEIFRRKYPQVFQRWIKAEELLWKGESAEEFTTIGHLCREAMQEFTSVLVAENNPPNVDPDKAHTIARLKAVFAIRTNLGTTLKPVLDSLVTYWGTVTDLVQRQEHGALKEGSPLIWEDGRRLVFQTAVVIYEIDRALSMP